MSTFQRLPTMQSGFERIREDNLQYVDKTKQLLTALSQGEYLFFSRPHRFGKSMLLNTLKALYEGKKHLFEGLYIYDKWEWKEYPVIHLGFSGMIYSSTKEAFEENISFKLKNITR